MIPDYTLRVVSFGAGALGLFSGVLGSFAMLRKQSLLGDAVSHAALPGIALAFLLTGSRDHLPLLLGAGLTGWLGALLVNLIRDRTRIREDAALGLTLSVLFGAGLVLLTFIQKSANAAQAGLDRFLFGQASTILESDLVLIGIVGCGAVTLVVLLWKELALVTFDRDMAAALGYPARRLELLLTSLLVVAIVIGLQMVGVVLMSALVVAPAAAARQWTDRLPVMVILSGFFGALAGIAGAMLSSLARGLATGPSVVLVLGLLAVLSILVSPRRGVVWGFFRARTSRRRLRAEAVLADLWFMSRQHGAHDHPHDARALEALAGDRRAVARALEDLADRGLVIRQPGNLWALTRAGQVEAEREAEARLPEDPRGVKRGTVEGTESKTREQR